MQRTALVTGGNRGIGLEVCRQLQEQGYRVVLTARDSKLGQDAVDELGDDVFFRQLDVSVPESVRTCVAALEKDDIQVDVLVNNAGVFPQGDAVEAGLEDLETALRVNTVGPFLTCRAFIPGMIERGYGRIVNMASGYGSFASGLSGPAAYSISKAALNALTVKLAQALPEGVKVNSMCPGWVRTRMGGENAARSVEEAADTAVWLASLPENGPSGGFFRDRRPIDW